MTALVSTAHVQPPVRSQYGQPDASTAALQAPFFRAQVAIQRVAHVLQRLAHPQTRRVQWTALIVIEDATDGRTIPKHDRAHLAFDWWFFSRSPTHRFQGPVRTNHAEIARPTRLGRRYVGDLSERRGSWLGRLMWARRLRSCNE